MNISFNFLAPVTLNKRRDLKAHIKRMFELEQKHGGQLNFIFCSDDYLLDINRTYLNHNYFTDIITFDLSQSNSNLIEGEIYISIDTVRSNAEQFHTTPNHELHRVIFHGVLHLLGYNDKTTAQQQLMTTKEDFYLNLYFGVS
ncbi:MAG: rRNA maturation RNase YbeY [Chitinophagaceae bacterium]|nr:MAG: rRNA maturation RNase YbeY [Chitinophagaceae bacterium]